MDERGRPGGRKASDLVGLTIDEKYRLDAEIGVGGMGVVYRATRLLIGDTVAIKIILPEHVSDQRAAQRFRREAQATALLKHPNAVAIYDFGTSSDGLVYLVMELVEGHSLRQIIKEQGPLSPQAVGVVINQVCAALDEAHRRNIIHRDLKPDNIIVTTTTAGLLVKVLDFGLAKLLDPGTTAGNLTQTGTVMGTPYYMSPEQFMGDELDSRSDIYSLGIVLYEMLAGVVPFNSPTPTAVVVQHVNQTPSSLRARNPNISPEVEAVVLRALEKRREARQQTAGQLAREFSDALRGAPPPPQEVFKPTPVSHPSASTPINVSHAPSSPPPARETVPTMVLNTPVSGSNIFPPPVTPQPPFLNGEVKSANGSKTVLPLVIVAVLALGLIAGGLVWWLLSEDNASKAGQSNQRKENDQTVTKNSGTSQTNRPSATPPVVAVNPADSELKSLRERRLSASSTDAAQVMEALKAAENKYPSDYRFTYERAKLMTGGSGGHHEAFELLFLAGKKAIDAGKATDMLDELTRDKSTDFRRLSSHGEWKTLEEALRTGNKTTLSGH